MCISSHVRSSYSSLDDLDWSPSSLLGLENIPLQKLL